MSGNMSEKEMNADVINSEDSFEQWDKRLVGESSKSEKKNEETKIETKSLSHGMVSMRGCHRTMEDEDEVTITVIEKPDRFFYDFFGVYDGHGGLVVARSCRDWMHRLIEEEMETVEVYGGGGNSAERELSYWKEVMNNSFSRMDSEVAANDDDIHLVSESGKTLGSTALVVMVDENVIVVANCGDCRVVLSHGGIPLDLSRDHKLDRPYELERIEAVGGSVVNRNGPDILGLLDICRSIGDYLLDEYVISKPEVSVTKRIKDVMVYGDVVSSELACDVVKRHLPSQSLPHVTDLL